MNTVGVPPVVYDCVRVVFWLARSTFQQTADLLIVVKRAPVLVHLCTVVQTEGLVDEVCILL